MVSVHAVRLPKKLDDVTYGRLLMIVDPEKRNRIQRFRHWQDAHRTLLADLLVRHLIYQTLDMVPQEVVFHHNAYHKPSLAGRDDFHFNCAHSGDWIVCAVGDHPIGIDVERIEPIDLLISRRFFSENENHALSNKGDSERLSFFYTLWTLKESYLKMVGKGLHQPLNSFSVSISSNRNIHLLLDDEIIPNIHFRSYPLDPDYSLAVCANSEPFPESIIVNDIQEIIQNCIPNESYAR